MTHSRNAVPSPAIYEVLVQSEGDERQLHFHKDTLEEVAVFRRTRDEEEWQMIGRNVQSPFEDSDAIKGREAVEYKVIFNNPTNGTTVARTLRITLNKRNPE